ncbi:HEXXH motif-containing putative peptide modification protein [Streptomyces sp. NPDC006393]|uniref:aKG-HExxH-type peptide beta-hydroxylase n=1 Tax=Streptomyces sp. NPDC006393 TaxID=3156763 RepID=UPI00340F6B8F
MTHDRPAAAAAAPPLTLPHDLWRQIARGAPDAGTLRLLRTARAGRNLLLLRAAHHASRTTPDSGGPDSGTGAGASTPAALLAAVRHRAPAVFDALVTDPAAGVLLAEAVRSGRRDPVAVLAAVAAHRAGIPFRLELAVRHGAVELPGLGRAVLGRAVLDPAADIARVERDPHGTTTITAPGTPTVVLIPDPLDPLDPPDPQDWPDPAESAAEPAPGWEPAPRVLLPAHRPGPAPVIRLDAHGPLDVGTPRPLGAHELARWRDRLGAAWEVLAARHPGHADAVRGTVRAVVPLDPRPPGPPGPPGGTRGAWLSASFSDAFGLVALAPLDDPAELAAALVHETQHSLLYALQDLTRLLDAPPGALGHAPWSDRPRPPSALLQGATAFLVTAGFWRREAALGHPDARAPYQRWRRTARIACDELARGGWLTESGHRLLDALRDVLAEWDDRPGPSGT